MNSLLVGAFAVVVLAWGYILYGKVQERLWDVDERRKTPAVELADAVDYVPAKHWTILFGHHFASIAGAGPILGPVIAVAVWGWVPALFWIILGSILIGGVHDFSSLMASLRHKGKSIGDISEHTISHRARILFATFLWLSLVLVVAVFTAVTATTLRDEPRIVLPTFGLIPVAILVGVMIYKWRINQIIATLIGLGLLCGLLVTGYHLPVSLTVSQSSRIWMLILLLYAFFASVTPVNILLQPRDYLSAFILFFGLTFGYLGIIISHPQINAPAFVQWSSSQGPLWPMLFVIIACGAISGFHSLVASGTTSKQLANEKDAKKVAYGGMIMEGILATLAVLVVSAGLYWTGGEGREGLVYPDLVKGGNWIITFGRGFGRITAPIFGPSLGVLIATLILNSFVLTTLDTATRINRYITQELLADAMRWKIFSNRYLATLIVILSAGYLAFGNWKAIWPVFGASNQLVAAFAMLIATLYLWGTRKPTKYTIYPGIFLLATTIGALVYQMGLFIRQANYTLTIITGILLVLAGILLREATFKLKTARKTA